jgi:phosphotransferase system enzyme I (PtsI)
MKSFVQIYKEANNKIAGIAAAPGIVIAKAYVYTKEKIEINDGKIVDVEEAKRNLEEAIAKSKKELNKIFSLAKEKMESTRAAIFEAQLMILDDPVLLENIHHRIEKERKQPEFIVNDEISKYQQMMIQSNEQYMTERANDIEDIKNRIIRNLQKKRWESRIMKDIIVVSDNLTPADTILFSRVNVQGFVTEHGGLTSHAAIISRSLNIPAIVGAHNVIKQIHDGDVLIVDGFHGYVLVNPTQEQIEFFKAKAAKHEQLKQSLKELKDKPAETIDGRVVKLLANVDVTGEIDVVITSGAQGIGLYRTEQVLEELGEFPSENQQAKIYSNLATRIYPNELTIRAFDIGGDKFKFFEFNEPNPFLGLRGIRLLLENKNLFKSQIRAVLKASKTKNISFMLPMVSIVTEIRLTKALIHECKEELKKEDVNFDKHMKIGIMIEVPSAAILSYDLAYEVDFISIGTNDLIQYIMAVDRGNDLVSNLYQEFNPAIVRTLYHIVQEAERAKKTVSLCGEMAADTLALPLLVGLGIHNLSVSPAILPYTKSIIRTLSFEKTKKLAEECLACSTQKEIIEKLEKFFKVNQIDRTRNKL